MGGGTLILLNKMSASINILKSDLKASTLSEKVFLYKAETRHQQIKEAEADQAQKNQNKKTDL